MTSRYGVPHASRSSERTWANLNAERIEHGLKEIPGVTRLMCSVFAEHGIQSVEDLAGCATDDLTGWWECRHGMQREVASAGSTSTWLHREFL